MPMAIRAMLFLGLAAMFPGSATGGAEARQWEQGEGYQRAKLSIPEQGKTGFTRMDGEVTGILFENALSDERSIANRNLLSGSGVAVGDVDGDGLLDLYFCRLDGPNVLYRNLGNWKFEDITESSGTACPGQDSTGAVFADLNGNGHLDLLVTALGGGVRIFENDGRGKFSEITDAAGVRSRRGSMSLALGDLNGNGRLDLYVVNYRPTTIMDQPTTRFGVQIVHGEQVVVSVNGRPATTPDLADRFIISPAGRVLELGEPDQVFLNEGQGGFSLLSFTSEAFLDEEGKRHAKPPMDWGLAVQIRDITGNGAPDIYVCNDLFTPDRIWINDGTGHFKALDNFSLRNTSTFSMGVDFADLNRNGHFDFFVTDMLSRNHQDRQVQVAESTPVWWPVGVYDDRPQFARNTLQINRGDGAFAELAFHAGVEASEWSWGPIFLDVDLDGYEDLLIPNGQLGDFQNADMAAEIEKIRASKRLTHTEVVNLVRLFPRLETPNVLFRNRGDLTFEEVGREWGFASAGISQGMALADLDNDGDLDVVVNNLNAPAGIYRNDSIAPRVAVRLKGLPPNTQGIGSKIKLFGGAVPVQSQEVICGGRYLSGDDPMRVFAAGTLTNRMRIEVEWRSGKRSLIKNVLPNHLYEIDESGANLIPSRNGPADQLHIANQKPKIRPPLFEDVSHLIRHRHHEEPFNDFERQPLLPKRLSQLGPGVSWQDISGDGWDDLLVASGRGGRLGLFLNDGQGGFRSMQEPQMSLRDQTTVLGWINAQKQIVLLAGSSNYEDGFPTGPAVRLYDLAGKTIDDSLPGQQSSSGPLALGALHGAGKPALFVGGRVKPGRYPEAASSLIFLEAGGGWTLDEKNSRKLENIGLVSGAVWSDLNGDGYAELILACEWGPVRVFQNEKGELREVTAELGLDRYKGWWNGVTTGDLTGDGQLEIIATNWGLNSRYRAGQERPLKLYYGDFAGNGTVEMVEAYYNEAMEMEVPVRGFRAMRMAIPQVWQEIKTFEEYGKKSIQEILREQLKTARVLEASTLESMVFFKRGGKYEGVPLPGKAQWAPAFGVNVGDLNGNGKEDLFLSQNFFAVNPESSRSDAGRGLWLRGDGQGGLEAVSGEESGIKVYGEQRGSALSDYDKDGRVDLVVSQNGADTRLFRNVGAKPGLRVRLIGHEENPAAIGGALRLMAGGKKGPLREIKGGSGYWSQDSLVQVLGYEEAPEEVWVRWPGGRTTQFKLPEGASEVWISPDGIVHHERR